MDDLRWTMMGDLRTTMPRNRTVRQKQPAETEDRTQVTAVRSETLPDVEVVSPSGNTPLPPPQFLVPDALRRQVLLAAEASSFDLPAGSVFCDERSVPPGPQKRLVVFTDGKLTANAAALLKRPDRPLLCALREGGRASEWELGMTLSCLGQTFAKPRTALWSKRTVSSYRQMLESADWANAIVERAGLPNSVQAQVADVAHELVTNALLSAPVDAKGRPKYATRRQDAVIDPADACELHVGVENARVYLLATDRWGTLSLEPVVGAVGRFESRAKVNAGAGGAGLGFRRMLEHSDLLLTRVTRKKVTSVLSVISAQDVRRRRSSPKSVLLVEG